LGVIYLTGGTGGLEKNDIESVRLFKLSSSQNNSYGQLYLARMYIFGRGGLNRDERQAAELYKLSANHRNSFAQFELGEMYLDGLGGLPQDPDEALKLFRLSAAQSNIAAINKLKLVEQDVKLWIESKDKATKDAFENYLLKYPFGIYANLARLSIAKFSSSSVVSILPFDASLSQNLKNIPENKNNIKP
jgi:hypothetical protein